MHWSFTLHAVMLCLEDWHSLHQTVLFRGTAEECHGDGEGWRKRVSRLEGRGWRVEGGGCGVKEIEIGTEVCGCATFAIVNPSKVRSTMDPQAHCGSVCCIVDRIPQRPRLSRHPQKRMKVEFRQSRRVELVVVWYGCELAH